MRKLDRGCVAVLFIAIVIVVNVDQCYSDCATNEFTCADGDCILKKEKCDGVDHCKDKSDEGVICSCDDDKSLYQCLTGDTCIFVTHKCDGHDDCPNGDDEDNCLEDRLSIKCKKDEWLCEDKFFCIPEKSRCDGVALCPDGSDEKNCNNTCDIYKCHNGKCLDDPQLICDGFDDCGDNSEEFHCATTCSLDYDLFACADNTSCLPLKMVCNGKADCNDGSDEGPLCTQKQCSTLNCPSKKCIQLPTGPKCHCGRGFAANNETSSCEDINECRTKPVCSQKCTNRPGSFECGCIADFHLDPKDNRTCLSNKNVSSWLYFSTITGIYKLNIEHNYEIRINDHLNSVVGIAADDEYVYWTENAPKGQRVARLKHNTQEIETIAINGVGSAEGLAVDWWTGNIYFTDHIYEHIVVCGPVASKCVTLITKDLHKPRGIALNPAKAQMYWADWGDKPHIGVAYMDGQDQRTFVEKDLHWPNGLTIDYPDERLYWVDAKKGTIESILLSGEDRKVVHFNDQWHAFNIQVLGSKLYWTDKVEPILRAINKFSAKHNETIVAKNDMRSLYTFHPLIQKKMNNSENPCYQKHCSHICLLSANKGHTCACSDRRLAVMGTICVDRKMRILIGYNHDVYQLEYEEIGVPKISEYNRVKLGKFVANRLAVNHQTGDLIVADNVQQVILQVRPGYRKQVTKLVSSGIGKVSSLAMDYATDNLYWTDSKQQTVEMFSLGMRRRTIIHMFHNDFIPYSMALAPKSGKLFVATNRNTMRLFQMSFNGAGVTMFPRKWKTPSDKAKVALAIDEDNSEIYIGMGKEIFSWNYEMDIELDHRSKLAVYINQLVIVPEGKRFFWTGGDDHIYWDSHSSNLDKSMWIHLAAKFATMPSTTPIALLPPTVYKSTHPCMTKNGGCSDICVNMGSGFTCMCGLGRTFKSPENRTCIAEIDCEFKCANGACITLSRVCNGKKDCADGSDETACHPKDITANHINCSYDEFKCFDGSECLEIDQKCDQHTDCKDGSDELHCENFNLTTRCHKHQFLCDNTRRCVDLISLCDNYDDCFDYSDEMLCDKPKSQRPSCGDLYDCGNGQCIDPSWVCDGYPDCMNKDDESSCRNFELNECNSGFFQCEDLSCVAINLVCDGHSDCHDGSDEFGCTATHAPVDENCHFHCPSNKSICVQKVHMCDKYPDCPRGEDERNCSVCSVDQFQCKHLNKFDINWCVEKAFVCDKEEDCSDGSDEVDCDHKSSEFDQHEDAHIHCHFDMFHCTSGECIDMAKVCNGLSDCKDGSDESDQCGSACKKDNCAHGCIELPTGHKCTCDEGYELGSDGKTCVDVNECLDRPCDQMCENIPGSFLCSCYPNFMLLVNKRSCKAMGSRPYLLYSSQSQMRKSSENPNQKELFWTIPMNKRIINMVADIPRQVVYANNYDLKAIYQIDLMNRTYKVVQHDRPGRMAVDWSSGNLYVATNYGVTGSSLNVCNFHSKRCVELVTLSKHLLIDHLEVDSREQLVFFIQIAVYHAEHPERTLYRARLDGTKRQPIYKPFPGSVFTLDVNKRMIYFVDEELGNLIEINYEGHQEQTIAKGLKDVLNPSVAAIAVFQSYVYITVMGRPYFVACATEKMVFSCRTTHMDVANAMHFLVIQDSIQPAVSDVCANHGCTRMCIPTSRGPKCVCHGGVQVRPGEKCPYMEGESDGDFIEGAENQPLSSFSGTDFEPNVAGKVVLILFLILSAIAGATYVYYRRRYFVSTFSITNSFTNVSLETSTTKELPPVVYKPNINTDPEGYIRTEITFDELASSNRSSISSRSQRSVIVSSTVSDESGEFSDATHLIMNK